MGVAKHKQNTDNFAEMPNVRPGEVRENRAQTRLQGASRPPDSIGFMYLETEYDSLVAGDGFEPSTFGL